MTEAVRPSRLDPEIAARLKRDANGLMAVKRVTVDGTKARKFDVVDMAHASTATLQAALKIAKQPCVVSHSSLEGWKNPASGTRKRLLKS